jgi:hypothetical protein
MCQMARKNQFEKQYELPGSKIQKKDDAGILDLDV